MSKAYSIRSQLLKWLLLPMLLLFLLDSSVLYHYANKLVQDTLDGELARSADEIIEFLQANSKNQLTDLSQDAKQDLLQDPTDRIFYSVLDKSGNVLLGERKLRLLDTEHKFNTKTKPKYYYSEINKEKVRIALVTAEISVASEQLNVFIQIAETLNKRTQLKEKVLVWILVPQIILIITASLLLWIGIKKSLMPLLVIDNQLSQRSAQDLQPILLDKVPLEVIKLVNSLNGLIDNLSQAIHNQNRFIADAAHQLRTPLAGIQAQIELLDKSQNLLEIKDRLNKISLSTERLIHLVSQLLVLAKNQKEAAYILNFEEIDLVSFVKHIILDFESHADNKNIELSYFGLNKKISINADAARLYDLIYNLIDNAIRYTQIAGKVDVGVTTEDGHICLNVLDNGIGILESDHENVFKRFYRGNESLEFGTGLGLAIVKEIADLHNATINILSHSASELKVDMSSGTRVVVIFP